MHAADLCTALGWKNIKMALKPIPQHVQPASTLGIVGSSGDSLICQAGCNELFARRTGGNAQKIQELVLAKVFQEDSGYESEDEPIDDSIQPDEPTSQLAEIAGLEQLAHQRAETNLVNVQALSARAAVLQAYQALDGDVHHPEFEAARATLLADMCRAYPTQYVSALEYIQSQGFSGGAALQIACVFGPDLKRAYRAERAREPLTHVAIYFGAPSDVCIYDRIIDSELLGSCWRSFMKHRAWFRERYTVSNQRVLDNHHLGQMSQTGGKPAPGWGAARTRAITSGRPTTF